MNYENIFLAMITISGLVVAVAFIKELTFKPNIREIRKRISEHEEAVREHQRAIEQYKKQIKKIEYERCDNHYH